MLEAHLKYFTKVSQEERTVKENWSKRYRRWCGLLFGAAALLLTLWVLFAGSDVGLSNSGDFHRVMRASSLSLGETLPNFTYVDTYVIDLSHGTALANLKAILFGAEGLDRYPSIHVFLVRLSVVGSLIVNKLAGWEMSVYHLWILGAMYAVLYAVGIGLLFSQLRLRRLWQDVLVKLVGLVMLCDIGYVAYFNSFYGEALEHVALVYCAAMLVRVLTHEPTVWDGVWCAAAALVYGWAKFFNIPLAILLVLVMEGIVLVRTRRKGAAAAGVAALLVLALVWCAVPGWMDMETNYNAVFYGVIRDVDVDTASGYLADMDLPEELVDYRDTNYYLDGVVASLEERGLLETAQSIGKGDLLRFYLTHPGRLWQQVKVTALHCGMIRPYYLANLGAGYPLMTYSSRMSLWSTLRDQLALDTVWGTLAVAAAFVLLAGVQLLCRTRPALAALPLLALLGALAYAFLLPVILNGEGDLAKHLFAFVELIDLLLLASLALALDRPTDHRWIPAVVGGTLIAVLAVPPLWSAVSSAWGAHTVHKEVEPGAYVSLGSYEGKALTWLVTQAEGNSLSLLCTEESIVLPFDQAGSNDWRSSSSRMWLNDGFLEGFTEEELNLMELQNNTVLLSDQYRADATAGNLDFACSHIAVLAARGYERAYRTAVDDVVTLPDIDLVAQLAAEGYNVAGNYWLETPYCRTVNLVRYVGTDGHVYFGAAETVRSLRPVVTITWTGQAISGSGSTDAPFVLVES